MKPTTTNLDPCGSVVAHGGEYCETLSKYLKIGVEPNLDKKTACLDMATFFPDLEQKITGSQIWDGFGTDLVDPIIWISGYLGQKSNCGRHPVSKLSTSY